MADYQKAFDFLMLVEDSSGKGIVTYDNGGKTRWGVAAEWAVGLPGDFYTTDAASSRADARDYYKHMYWVRICGDAITSDKVAAQFLSIAVNMGVEHAVVLMQLCLGITQDGICGSETINTLNEKNQIMLLTQFNAAALARYEAIVRVNPALAGNLRGWQDRVTAIYHFPVSAYAA